MREGGRFCCPPALLLPPPLPWHINHRSECWWVALGLPYCPATLRTLPPCARMPSGGYPRMPAHNNPQALTSPVPTPAHRSYSRNHMPPSPVPSCGNPGAGPGRFGGNAMWPVQSAAQPGTEAGVWGALSAALTLCECRGGALCAHALAYYSGNTLPTTTTKRPGP